MRYIKDVNIKIFHKILFHVRKKMNSKQFKAFYFWSLALSLDKNNRYIHGNVSLYGIHRSFFIDNFGKYGYEIWNTLKENDIFFVKGGKYDHDILRAKPVEKIISEFNLQENALEYSTVKCDLGFTNFKNAIIKSLLGSMMKKEIAKLLNVSQQTISNILKKKIEVVKFVKKTWKIIRSIDYDNLNFALSSFYLRNPEVITDIEENLIYNDLVPDPIPI